MKEDTLDQSLENGDKCHDSSVVLGVHQPLLGGGSAAVDTREGLLKTTRNDSERYSFSKGEGGRGTALMCALLAKQLQHYPAPLT